MATNVPDLKIYNIVNNTNVLIDQCAGMNEIYGGRTWRGCPTFRTNSGKLEIVDGSRLLGGQPVSARLLAFDFLGGVADLMLGEQLVKAGS